MRHATTPDLPVRITPMTLKDMMLVATVPACPPLLLVVIGGSGRRRMPPRWESWLMLAAVVLATVTFAILVVRRLLQRRPRLEGTTYSGTIESKMGEGIAIEVAWGRLYTLPFVVRLDDGRAALVEPHALILETDRQHLHADLGTRVELIGEPAWSADAPVSVYRESTVMCFRGKPEAPVGIRFARDRTSSPRRVSSSRC